ASHTFNLLDARRAISVTERQRYILRVRTIAKVVAECYCAQRAKLGFPGLNRQAACTAEPLPAPPRQRRALRNGSVHEPATAPVDRNRLRGTAGQGPARPGPGAVRRRPGRPGTPWHRFRPRAGAPAVHAAAPGGADRRRGPPPAGPG